MFGWPAPRMLGRPLFETLKLDSDLPQSGGLLETTAVRKDGHELEVVLTVVPVSMSQSLEFNGFLEALEIAAPRGNALSQLQQSHHTVVEWIHAAVAGQAHLDEEVLSAGTIVAFRAVGAPPPPLAERRGRRACAPAAGGAGGGHGRGRRGRDRSLGGHRTRARADRRRPRAGARRRRGRPDRGGARPTPG